MLSQIRTAFSIVPLLVKLPATRAIRRADEAVDFAMNSRFIRPGQVHSEFLELSQCVAGLAPRAAMEIGTLRGGTLFTLCHLAHPEATIVSLDLPGGEFGGGYRWFQEPIFRSFASPKQTLHLIRGNSHHQESKNKVESALGGQQLDFLFIDGDHTFAGVKQDFEMYAPLVRKGGMIAFHDIAEHPPRTGCEVDRFWNEIKHSFAHQEIIADRRQGWAGIGLLTV